MQFWEKRVWSLKVDFLRAIVGFTAPKQPKIVKFTLNLKDQVHTCESLVHSHSSKSQGHLSNASQAQGAQSQERVPSLLI